MGNFAVNEMLETSDIQEEQMWRANAYSMLGSLLAKPPTQDVLAEIARINISDQDAGASTMARAYKELSNLAKTECVELIQEEYHQLFIGITGGEIIPYASWYLTGFLMEKPLALLRSDLLKLGIKRQKAVTEPEDHAAALCEVMNLLVSGNNNRQGYFFNAHLAPWAGRFFSDLRKRECAKFYRAVGLMGESFIRVEQDYFDMLALDP